MTTRNLARLGILTGACAALFGTTPLAFADAEPIPNFTTPVPIALTAKGAARTVTVVARTTQRVGDNVGAETHGMFCGGEVPLTVKDLNVVRSILFTAVTKELERAGYARFEPNESAFDNQEGKSADFKLGATVKSYRFVMCRGSGTDVTGGAYYKIFWELFSTRQQKVIFSATTEGSYNNKETMKFADMVNKAQYNALDSLLALPAFVSAYESDADAAPAAPAAAADGTAPAAVAPPASAAAGQEPITVLNAPPLKGGVQANVEALRAAVFTVETTAGSGSGFLIDSQGYIITNRHVVLDEKYVRIKMANGKSVPGQVLRRDSARDVALVKIDPIDVNPLAIRMTPPTVTEEVYAIGSPLGRNFAGTITKGIISANNRGDVHQPFIQADVGVTHGNSGGPLLDTNGQVIGISTSGFAGTPLNFFIPINDALKKLSVDVR